MKVFVTQDHIDTARRLLDNIPSAYCCPIAQAIGGKNVCVGDIEATSDGKIWAPLPIEAQEFVIAFDKGKYVEPIEFELSL